MDPSDIFARKAAEHLKKPVEQVTKQERDHYKTLYWPLLYSGTINFSGGR